MRLKIACLGLTLWASGACAETALESSEVLLLAGGALPLCTSATPAQCRGLAPEGRRSTPERFVADKTGQRLREVVNFDASKSAASKAIYLHFVAMARAAHQVRTGKRIARPKIAFLTSASIDPYDAVDFYQSAFEQAGADAVWLPLDGAVREAFGASCARIGQIRSRITLATDRSAIYPDLANIQRQFCQDRSRLLAILSEADGLFFNGGDQSLSKRAWFDADQPIPEFALIQKRQRLAQLAIGGTSAGTAVMSSGVMITNGLSEVALKRGAKAVPAPQLGCGEKIPARQGCWRTISPMMPKAAWRYFRWASWIRILPRGIGMAAWRNCSSTARRVLALEWMKPPPWSWGAPDRVGDSEHLARVWCGFSMQRHLPMPPSWQDKLGN